MVDAGPPQGLPALVPASRKRRALAAYLDFVLFSVPWTFVHIGLADLFPWLDRIEMPLRILAYTVFEVILLKAVRWSPGNRLLGITLVDPRYSPAPIEPGRPRAVALADARIVNGESVLSVLAGVWLLLDGCKGMVRWTMWTPPLPFFGVSLDTATSAAAMLAFGAVEIWIATRVLALRRGAFAAGLLYSAFSFLFVAASWNLWDGWAAEQVARRRAWQGIAVRPGEIETIQGFVPEVLLIGPALQALAFLMIRRRLAHR